MDTAAPLCRQPAPRDGDSAPAAAGTAPPQTALAAMRQRLRARAWRTLWFMVALCTGIALLLSASRPGKFGVHLLYSAAIGASCLLATDGTRLALAWLSDRLRAGRGLAPSPAGLSHGWHGALPAMLVALAVGPAFGLWLADSITGYRSPALLSLDDAGARLTLALTLLACLVATFALGTLERLSSARAQAEAAQRLAAENQLRLLQSQLEPHMLFNTLANLRVLIALDPERAQAMLDRLIAFLRRTLGASRADAHPLADEFSHLADYLALMAVRMGPRLQTQLDLPSDLATVPVPPLLLQPLVENAIKHGLEPKVAGGRITVSARRGGGERGAPATLVLTVRDTGIGLAAAAQAAGAATGTSFGLQQVRSRLATLHGSAATLQLRPAADGDDDGGDGGGDGGTLVSITLPLTPANPPLPATTR